MGAPKGHKWYGGGMPKGKKIRDTLKREERRAVFDEKISQKWEETIDKLKPEYVADQFMGKPQENVNVRFFKPFKKLDELLGNNSIPKDRKDKKSA